MTGTKTLTIIKPCAVSNEFIGPILDKINGAGFHIAAMKLLQLTRSQAESFYKVHEGKDFYEPLIEFMTSGPVVVAILEKRNAVYEYRMLIGSTDPAKAKEGTIRKDFATDIEKNVVHGSDAQDTAKFEISYFFNELEIVGR